MLLNRGIPRLENGDRLTRPEFERRYTAMTQVKKAELIEGIVYMPSPVRVRQHGRPHGVQEYLVWQIYEQQLSWFSLQAGDYVLLPANNQGIICSQVFPGLWLAALPLLQSDLATVIDFLRQGLQTSEHAAFKRRLAADMHRE